MWAVEIMLCNYKLVLFKNCYCVSLSAVISVENKWGITWGGVQAQTTSPKSISYVYRTPNEDIELTTELVIGNQTSSLITATHWGDLWLVRIIFYFLNLAILVKTKCLHAEGGCVRWMHILKWYVNNTLLMAESERKL